MVTPRERRKIDINVGVGVGVVSISHRTLAHTHSSSSGRSKAGFLCRLDANVLDMVKTLCRCVDFARFAFVLFHFSIRTERTPNGNLRLSYFYEFRRSLSLSLSLLHSFYQPLNFTLDLCSPFFSVTCSTENFRPNFYWILYVMLPHRAHYLSSQSTPQSNSLWISCLSIVCLCVYTALCTCAMTIA